MKLKLRKFICLLSILCLMFSMETFAVENTPDSKMQNTNGEYVSKNLLTGELDKYNVNNTLTRGTELSMPGFSGNSLIETRGIIGDDNRYIIKNPNKTPYKFIANIEIRWPNYEYTDGGTAWMMGPSVAVTAGHCVYDASKGGVGYQYSNLSCYEWQ